MWLCVASDNAPGETCCAQGASAAVSAARSPAAPAVARSSPTAPLRQPTAAGAAAAARADAAATQQRREHEQREQQQQQREQQQQQQREHEQREQQQRRREHEQREQQQQREQEQQRKRLSEAERDARVVAARGPAEPQACSPSTAVEGGGPSRSTGAQQAVPPAIHIRVLFLGGAPALQLELPVPLPTVGDLKRLIHRECGGAFARPSAGVLCHGSSEFMPARSRTRCHALGLCWTASDAGQHELG